jgi:hypothetical protein
MGQDHASDIVHRVRAIVRESVVLLEPDFLAGGIAAIAPRLSALRERVREEGLLAPHLPRPSEERACPWPRSGGSARSWAGRRWATTSSTARPRTSATWSCCSITGAPSRRSASCARWPRARSGAASR